MSTHLQDSHAFHGISLQVSITVAPENIDTFLAALKPCFDAVTKEPECTFFEVFHDLDNPGHFRFVENWSKSREWFINEQITKDYYKPYIEATEPLWIKPREMNFFNRMPAGWIKAKPENMKAGWM